MTFDLAAWLNLALRWLHLTTTDGPRWYVNGERLAVPKRALPVVRRLARGAVLPRNELDASLLAAHERLGGVELKPVRRSAASRRAR